MNNNTKARSKRETKANRRAKNGHGRVHKHAKVAWCGGQK